MRSVAGDMAESVTLIDEFTRDSRVSHCYRIAYRSLERNLTNDEINVMQDALRDEVASSGWELR